MFDEKPLEEIGKNAEKFNFPTEEKLGKFYDENIDFLNTEYERERKSWEPIPCADTGEVLSAMELVRKGRENQTDEERKKFCKAIFGGILCHSEQE